ncbi:hypothetical protein NPIL_248191 [Nephila pilipes]|uniref:Uncharacterized protein n=1 Tax=Nephila pilipes TaxID=299642 RepID=A0A8X6PKU3_NEPPI|nr:hypothetical protein NPIL_248191 [Nephila pilipes]
MEICNHSSRKELKYNRLILILIRIFQNAARISYQPPLPGRDVIRQPHLRRRRFCMPVIKRYQGKTKPRESPVQTPRKNYLLQHCDKIANNSPGLDRFSSAEGKGWRGCSPISVFVSLTSSGSFYLRIKQCYR